MISGWRIKQNRIARFRLSNLMLSCGRTTPQDYPERSGFPWRRERECGHRRHWADANRTTPPMRIYIIGNDGITLCREPPPAVNEGEIVVASKEELHAARLSGKRLLPLPPAATCAG